MRIMLIDDDCQTLDMLKNALNLNGYDCEAFDNSVEAAENYSPVKYDVVLCDYIMPQMNGLGVLKSIKERCKDQLFILYSASPDISLVKEAMSIGATDFLEKPMDWATFIDLLRFYDFKLS